MIDIYYIPDSIETLCEDIKSCARNRNKTGVMFSQQACYQLIGLIKELNFQLKQTVYHESTTNLKESNNGKLC